MTEATIRALPIFRDDGAGDVRIEPLSGGITNLNFRVIVGDAQYAARTGEDDPALGIDRRNELACTEIAAARGIAPRVAYSAPGVLVSDFVDGEPLTPSLIREPSRLARVARTIHSIHDAGTEVVGHLQYFCAFQVARTYVAFATEHDLTLPGSSPRDLLAGIRELQDRMGPFTPTFCHNDMMPGNFLDTGDRLWVIDWEYSGMGHRAFDLAGLSSNCELDGDQDEQLLGAYGTGISDGAEFRVLKAMAALRESLWAVVQGSQSRIEFDYDGYRDDNYRKFEVFRAAALRP